MSGGSLFRFFALGKVLLLLSCASGGKSDLDAPLGPSGVRARGGSDGTGGLSAEDVDLTDAALIASGFEGQDSLRSARARFEGWVAPLVDQLKSVRSPRDRGKKLLTVLHNKGGFLGEYDARATTLQDILDRRRYNCVSASVLYNLLAERLDLEASAQLLPTHARSILKLEPDAPPIIVETTSSEGFDPDARMQATILAHVGGAIDDGRAIVSDEGTIVGTRVLVGTIYVNRASIAQEGGDLQGAERLFERGEALAGSAEMRQILRDQRAALLSQLGANDVLSEDASRVDRAYRSMRAAVELRPEHAQIRAAVLQNLRAAAERKIHALADAKDEAGALAIADEAGKLGPKDERMGLKAFALSEIARVRIEGADFQGAVDVLESALRLALSPRDAGLTAALVQNHVSALRLLAITHAKQGDYDRASRTVARLRNLPKLTDAQRKDADADQLRVIHLAGNRHIESGDFSKALDIYREGVSRFPEDGNCRHNLVAVLERLVVPLLSAGQCAEARVYLAEIERIEPASRFPATAKVRCLMQDARERLEAEDFAPAVELMRAARREAPSEPSVKDNLALALLRWVRSLSAAGDCSRAETLTRELKALDAPSVSDVEIGNVLDGCRRRR